MLGCCADENCVKPTRKSPLAFTATCGCEYHLPPFVAVAVGSSSRPPSTTAPLGVVSRVHWTPMCVCPVEGSPTLCVYQIEPLRKTGAERICESCDSIGQGVAPQALVPETGADCGSWLPVGCTQLPPGRTCEPPAV